MTSRFLVVACLLASIFMVINAGCPSRKMAAKRQVVRITKSLEKDHIVLEAQFVSNFEDKPTSSRFIVEHIWEKNNGDLKLDEVIEVVATDSSLDSCYQQLVPEKSYFLVLRKNAGSNTFDAVEPPVSSRRKKVKDAAWKRLCTSASGNCALRIAMPKTSVVYQGSIIVVECKIKSKSEITSVEWEKDGASVDSPTYRSLGIDVIAPNKEGSAIMIVQANHIHNGKYTCSAMNSDNQVGKGTTVVTVYGPQAENNYKQCKEQTYCLNGGTCHTFLDESLDKFCMCPPGYEGARCEENDEDITNIVLGVIESDKNQALSFQLSQMTVAIVVLATLLVGFIVVGLIYTRALRKKLSKTDVKSDFYDDAKILKDEKNLHKHDELNNTQTIEITRHNSGIITPVMSLLSNENEQQTTLQTSSLSTRSSSSSSNTLDRKRSDFANHKLTPTSRSRLKADS